MLPAVEGNVMLRWESVWWFYPRIGLGNESDRSGCRDAVGGGGSLDVMSAERQRIPMSTVELWNSCRIVDAMCLVCVRSRMAVSDPSFGIG